MSFTDMRKPDSSQHLTPEQIRSAVEGAGEQPAHLNECAACAETVRQLRLHSHSPAPELDACIPRERMLVVAGGQGSFAPAEISHLLLCQRCSHSFKDFTADLDDAKPEEIAGLSSNSASWRSAIAGRMAALSPVARPPLLAKWKFVFAFGAAAAAILAVILVLRFSAQRSPASRLLAHSFEKRRVTSMRIEGAHFAPITVTRGSNPSIADLPSEGLEAAALARRNLDKNATDPYWHAVQGEVFLLQGAPERAVTEFRIAQAADPSSSSYQLQLGSALCDTAIQKGLPSAYVEGLDVLRSFVAAHKQNTVALYNLGVCLYHAGLLNEAKAELQQARQLERDPSWFADIDQWLKRIDDRLKAEAKAPIPDFGWKLPEGASPTLVAAVE